MNNPGYNGSFTDPMPPADQGNLTLLLRQLRSGDRSVEQRVAELIYPELRRLASSQMRAERQGHVLQRTALVNEAYLRLVAHDDHNWQSRAHFFGAAARTMRRILIDYARKQRPRQTVPVEDVAEALPARERSVDLLALDTALSDLERLSPDQVRIVELRYFTGLTIPEIAEVIGRSPRTVNTYWEAARRWLQHLAS